MRTNGERVPRLPTLDARTVSVIALVLVGLSLGLVLEDSRGVRGAAVGVLCLGCSQSTRNGPTWGSL